MRGRMSRTASQRGSSCLPTTRRARVGAGIQGRTTKLFSSQLQYLRGIFTSLNPTQGGPHANFLSSSTSVTLGCRGIKSGRCK